MKGWFSLSFVSCQLVAKFILLRAGFRLSWGKTETKLKQGCGRWKTFSKGMVHRIIATIAVNLVWNTSVAKNFSSWLRLPGCWIYERTVTKSRHWYLLLLSPSQYRPSKANSAFPSISGKTHPCCNHFPTISIIFAANPIIFVFNSASRSHCLRYWPLYYTRSCIRKKKTRHLKTTTLALEATSVLAQLRFIIPWGF